MYDPGSIVNVISQNVAKTGNPFGALPWTINRWWKKASLPREGNTLLLTGMMIQFLPLIRRITSVMERFEDTPKESWIKHASLVPPSLLQLGSLLNFLSSPSVPYDKMIRNIVELLKISGIRFAYRPDLDCYSGILLYELGDEEVFAEHARKVANLLQNAGVRVLITVDPHTTYAFKVLYPDYTGVKFQVFTYIELLQLQSDALKGVRITLHDPCLYGRYLHLSHVPRQLLANLGVEIAEIQQSGAFTHCCGGPAESVSPKLSREIALKRLEQLGKTRAPIITMCPVCFENLKRAGGNVEDLASFLTSRIKKEG